MKNLWVFMLLLALASCSANKFGRKQHSHRNWQKANPELKEADQNVAENRAHKIPVVNNQIGHKTHQDLNSSLKGTTEKAKVGEQKGATKTDSQAGKNGIDQPETQKGAITIPKPNPHKNVHAEIKDQGQGYKTDGHQEDSTMLIILVILAIVLPPLAVYLYEGVTNRFWLNLILALLGWGFGWILFPHLAWAAGVVAVVHALLIVLGKI